MKGRYKEAQIENFFGVVCFCVVRFLSFMLCIFSGDGPRYDFHDPSSEIASCMPFCRTEIKAQQSCFPTPHNVWRKRTINQSINHWPSENRMRIRLESHHHVCNQRQGSFTRTRSSEPSCSMLFSISVGCNVSLHLTTLFSN